MSKPQSKRNSQIQKTKATSARIQRGSAPISTSFTVRQRAPKGTLENNKFRVVHSEYVDSITFSSVIGSAGEFALVGKSSLTPGYSVNPANLSLFPWLSAQAVDWERYTVGSLTFRLLPKQPATSQGWVAMAFDYDDEDAPSTTKREFLTNMSIVEGSTWKELTLKVDSKQLNQPVSERFVSNTNELSAPKDPRLTNAGYLEICVDGYADSVTLSWDLWVDYDIVFSVPRIASETSTSTVSGATRPLGAAGNGHVFDILPDNIKAAESLGIKLAKVAGPALASALGLQNDGDASHYNQNPTAIRYESKEELLDLEKLVIDFGGSLSSTYDTSDRTANLTGYILNDNLSEAQTLAPEYGSLKGGATRAPLGGSFGSYLSGIMATADNIWEAGSSQMRAITSSGYFIPVVRIVSTVMYPTLAGLFLQLQKGKRLADGHTRN